MKLGCHEAQRMISPFLANEISNKERAAFLSHMESCPRCMHELETSFMITYALKHIDNNDNFSFDIKGLLQEKLKKDRIETQLRTFATFAMWILIVLMGAAIVFLISGLFFRELLPDIGKDFLEVVLSAIDGAFAGHA